MSHEQTDPADQTSCLRRDDGEDRILAALDFLRGGPEGDGPSSGQATLARQKARLKEWAESLDFLLSPEAILPQLKRGGQEHDVFAERERFFKVTRSGVFGLTPGIELALVPADQDARRFHLWEASPWQYLERLRLQNLITPGLNRLEGIIIQDDDLAICISQPRLEIVAVTQREIDSWFVSQGFQIVTTAAYYREEDNLGVFDAHDKNVVCSPIDSGTLIPFDVIPVQPDGGFLEFIRETLVRGDSVSVERTTRTKTRASD
ncbi:MAG: hypothetical protein KA152_04150 [Verrucomicrobiales bacterium]|nr:hypothetical protein [Verrucomicrobiales bacterium]HQW27741.1 hypothetical protein [Verrucomicrobiales bacterium]